MSKSIDYSLLSKISALDKEKKDVSQYVYHYTKEETIKLIFQADSMSFKLTKATEFDDKLEGNCADAFWDLALEELEDAGVISKSDRCRLELVKPANVGFLYQRESDSDKLFKSGPSTTYIGCFSMVENDSYMVNEYIKNERHNGIRIKLSASNLLDWSKKIGHFGYDVSLIPVIYGREVVDELKHYLLALIDIFGNVSSEQFESNGISLLKGKLLRLKYMAKTGKYRHENECRIVLRVPISKPTGYEGYEFEKVEGGILFKVPKYALRGYEFKNMNEKEISDAECLLKNNGYRVYSKV